jgi:methyltransferase
MDSRLLFTAVIALVAGQRLVELVVSRRNERRLRARGAVEHGTAHWPYMVAMHAAFLVACVAEPWLLDRPLRPWLAAAAGGVVLLALALRGWTLVTLGGRWTARVLVLPGEPLVARGPYRWIRHPNYTAVVLEIAALPLLHAAWLTATVFTALNAAVLAVRIRVEERALTAARAEST